MESNKNNNNNNEGGEHQQWRGSAQKRKLNELAKDGDKPAAAGYDDKNCSSEKNRVEGNDLLDLELERLSREELIKLVRKQMGMTMEAQKQLEAAKKESQHKVEELTTEMAKLNAEYQKIVEFSNTTMDLPHPHRKLPAELNREIFYCLNLATRRKFICRLGWKFYAMFRQILLKKSKRLCNPVGNVWRSNNNITISEDGLMARNNTNRWLNIYAEKGFPFSGADSRMDHFPGTICYYYEVKILNSAEGWCMVGLSNGDIPRGQWIGLSSNSYAICIEIPDRNYYEFRLAGHAHPFEYPEGVIRPERKETGNVIGCGILMNTDDKLTIFFTVNGILVVGQFKIDPTVDHLFPSVTLRCDMSLDLEANFGDNSAKPFEYDIKKCPGMGLEWI